MSITKVILLEHKKGERMSLVSNSPASESLNPEGVETMATLTVTAQKINKVFRATLRDEPGTLTKLAGEILFFHDSGEMVSIEPEDCVWLCVLGEMGLSEGQKVLDDLHGSYAHIACSRLQEVQ
jgi:tRNA A37 threonylcarbamoyladenosine dehydratase